MLVDFKKKENNLQSSTNMKNETTDTQPNSNLEKPVDHSVSSLMIAKKFHLQRKRS